MMRLIILAALLGTLLVSGAAVDAFGRHVSDALVRTIGPIARTLFTLQVAPMPGCGKLLCFELEGSNNTVTGMPQIRVTATGLAELGYGAAWYLRRYCNMSFSWVRTGGNQVRAPSVWPLIPGKVVVTKAKQWTYYQNVVTGSYSMWWWDWPRWEKELDWCVLNGINLALAYTGQEQLYRTVYGAMGVNDSVILGTFDGPAFLAWSRGQGSAGVGGPLPDSWMRQQVALNQNITLRMRQLGISPILSAFQGNVPAAFSEIFPGHNISNSSSGDNGAWLDCQDPLFTEIGQNLAQVTEQAFGINHFFQADGWFDTQTGPWVSHGVPSHKQTNISCLGPMNFQIPTAEEGRRNAAVVFQSFAQTSSDAVWVYQGYPWSRVMASGDCDVGLLASYIKGFVSGIPKDANGTPRLLVLDLIADYNNTPWQLWNGRNGTLLAGASSVWCALDNWGGAVHVGGDLSYAMAQSRLALASENVAGVGLTPEGIDNNPAYYQLVLDAPWLLASVTAESFLLEWGAQRCGKDLPQIRTIYDILFHTLYRPSQDYLFCCSKPLFCPTASPAFGWDDPSRPSYNVSLLRQAWALMAEAAPLCDTDTFRYDLIDVGREYLSMVPCVAAWDRMQAAIPNKGQPLADAAAALLDVSLDVDTLMKTHSGFLLGSWLHGSRALGGANETLADFYEWNARSQITTWVPVPDASGSGGISGLSDYARKEWSGAVATYYMERVRIWLNFTLNITPMPPLGNQLAAFAYKWQHTAWSPEQLPAVPVGDPVAVSRAMLAKYPA